MEKNYTKEQILGFNESDWLFERSSGHGGYRNIDKYSKEFNKWVCTQEFLNYRLEKNCYEKDYKLISEFRGECLPFGEYPEYVIQEFLNKKYFK